MLLRTRIITYGAEDEARKSVSQNAGDKNVVFKKSTLAARLGVL
jgi:hypothetical protein